MAKLCDRCRMPYPSECICDDDEETPIPLRVPFQAPEPQGGDAA